MKRVAPGVILACCVLAALFAGDFLRPEEKSAAHNVLPAEVTGRVITTRQADLDLDGAPETIAITCESVKRGHPLGGTVIVMQQSDDGLKVVDQKTGLNPWKLQIADVDGDRKQEIILGVWKKSPKDPVMAKRVFVYSWDGRQMAPKWLGSRLSRRFEDFEFRDINNDGWDELLALEVSPGRPMRIGIYRWRSFGFEWLRSEKPEKWEELTK